MVAGTCKDWATIRHVETLCDGPNVTYVGDVRGKEKARLYAKAKALLFPTRQQESFGLVMVEAMFSGTPVICSANGACAEVMSAECGFVCSNEESYLEAIDRIDEISSAACRKKALRDYHYRTMADRYLEEYKKEIESRRPVSSR